MAVYRMETGDVKQFVPLAAVLLAIWIFDRWSWYRWKRRRYHEMFDADDARHEAWEAERRRKEAERTKWRAEDSGFIWTPRPGTHFTDPTKIQPWNFRPLWQGLIHSSARPRVEAVNAAWAAWADEHRTWLRSLRRGAARQIPEGNQG